MHEGNGFNNGTAQAVLGTSSTPFERCLYPVIEIVKGIGAAFHRLSGFSAIWVIPQTGSAMGAQISSRCRLYELRRATRIPWIPARRHSWLLLRFHRSHPLPPQSP